MAVKYGWQSLRSQAWTKVQSGMISVFEQQRLTLRVDEFPLARKRPAK